MRFLNCGNISSILLWDHSLSWSDIWSLLFSGVFRISWIFLASFRPNLIILESHVHVTWTVTFPLAGGFRLFSPSSVVIGVDDVWLSGAIVIEESWTWRELWFWEELFELDGWMGVFRVIDSLKSRGFRSKSGNGWLFWTLWLLRPLFIFLKYSNSCASNSCDSLDSFDSFDSFDCLDDFDFSEHRETKVLVEFVLLFLSDFGTRKLKLLWPKDGLCDEITRVWGWKAQGKKVKKGSHN